MTHPSNTSVTAQFGAGERGEPVAWRWRYAGDIAWTLSHVCPPCSDHKHVDCVPLYAAPVSGSDAVADGAVMGKPRVVGHTELCLFLLPFLQQGDFTVEALVTAILADFQVIDRAALRSAPVKAVGSEAQDLVNAIGTAEIMLSEHIEEFHDFDYEPHAVPPELDSLRAIQHHLLGSLIADDGKTVGTIAHPGSGDAEPGAWRSALHLAREYISQDHGGYKEGDGYWEQTRDILAEINSALAAPVSHTSVKDGGIARALEHTLSEYDKMIDRATNDGALSETGRQEIIDSCLSAKIVVRKFAIRLAPPTGSDAVADGAKWIAVREKVREIILGTDMRAGNGDSWTHKVAIEAFEMIEAALRPATPTTEGK